jgi:hypothetical protein
MDNIFHEENVKIVRNLKQHWVMKEHFLKPIIYWEIENNKTLPWFICNWFRKDFFSILYKLIRPRRRNILFSNPFKNIILFVFPLFYHICLFKLCAIHPFRSLLCDKTFIQSSSHQFQQNNKVSKKKTLKAIQPNLKFKYLSSFHSKTLNNHLSLFIFLFTKATESSQ